MLNINYPKIEKKEFTNLELNLVEPMNKLNLRGKSRDFLSMIGKILNIILPTETNTSKAITDRFADSFSPVWDLNQKQLYFLASTNVALGSGWANTSAMTSNPSYAAYVINLDKNDFSIKEIKVNDIVKIAKELI